jgi:predicted nuclease with TOPRIM domain
MKKQFEDKAAETTTLYEMNHKMKAEVDNFKGRVTNMEAHIVSLNDDMVIVQKEKEAVEEKLRVKIEQLTSLNTANLTLGTITATAKNNIVESKARETSLKEMIGSLEE